MNVLVAGGAGYVGGAVTDILLYSEECHHHQFRVYDSLLYEESYRKPIPFVRGDIRDRERLLPHLRWADAVIWLAAVVGDAACALDPAVAVTVNQESVRWLANNFSGRIVFLSTCSVYGAAVEELDETSPTNPLSVYASTKLAAESYLSFPSSSASASFPASCPNAIIFRLGTLFGLGDTYSRVRFDLVVNTLALRAQQTGKISVFGGKQYRPLLHVRDAAKVVVRALTQPQCGIYNIAQENWTISALADWVDIEIPGLVIERTPQQFEDNRNYRVSAEKARRELEFGPQISVAEGIREIRDLLASGRLADPSLPRHWNAQFLSAKGAGK